MLSGLFTDCRPSCTNWKYFWADISLSVVFMFVWAMHDLSPTLRLGLSQTLHAIQLHVREIPHAKQSTSNRYARCGRVAYTFWLQLAQAFTDYAVFFITYATPLASASAWQFSFGLGLIASGLGFGPTHPHGLVNISGHYTAVYSYQPTAIARLCSCSLSCISCMTLPKSFPRVLSAD